MSKDDPLMNPEERTLWKNNRENGGQHMDYIKALEAFNIPLSQRAQILVSLQNIIDKGMIL